jgi:hypothetical protein
MMLAPGEESADCTQIGDAGVLVADGRAKNSRKRRAAWSPASTTIAGTAISAAMEREICGGLSTGTTVSSPLDFGCSPIRDVQAARRGPHAGLGLRR